MSKKKKKSVQKWLNKTIEIKRFLKPEVCHTNVHYGWVVSARMVDICLSICTVLPARKYAMFESLWLLDIMWQIYGFVPLYRISLFSSHLKEVEHIYSFRRNRIFFLCQTPPNDYLRNKFILHRLSCRKTNHL